MVTVQAFTALMHTSQVMLVVATASSFWPLLSLGEVWESNSDVGVIIRHTLIVRGEANSPHIRQKCRKERQAFQNWSWPIPNPTPLDHRSNSTTIQS